MTYENCHTCYAKVRGNRGKALTGAGLRPMLQFLICGKQEMGCA